MSNTIRVDVPLGDRSYPVLVGAGARHELGSVLRESELTAGAQRAAVVTQPGIGVDVDPGIPFEVFTIPDGEQAKELATIGELCSGFARFGLTRRDVVVGVGGGAVTDVAGFAAAVYHRGVAVAHVATTLLGQIDAAVGGKTGVNLAEGKNLVGAFWQPAAVLCDTEVLDTLPERELRAGYGELAKYHFHRLHAAGSAAHRFPPVAVGAPGWRRAAQRAGRCGAGGGVRGHQGRGGGV